MLKQYKLPYLFTYVPVLVFSLNITVPKHELLKQKHGTGYVRKFNSFGKNASFNPRNTSHAVLRRQSYFGMSQSLTFLDPALTSDFKNCFQFLQICWTI